MNNKETKKTNRETKQTGIAEMTDEEILAALLDRSPAERSDRELDYIGDLYQRLMSLIHG